ncbi:hypothetical protein [Bacteroides sp.]|nr:hypothetical protein [Bacteroides sp.]MDD3040809.1 hypothetical protein [Bacteroides sp.]
MAVNEEPIEIDLGDANSDGADYTLIAQQELWNEVARKISEIYGHILSAN